MSFYFIYFIILFLFLFFLWEWKPLVKQGHWRDLAVAFLFLIIAITYGLDYVMDLKILPNPDLLFNLVKPVSEAFEKFFQVAG